MNLTSFFFLPLALFGFISERKEWSLRTVRIPLLTVLLSGLLLGANTDPVIGRWK
jgi:hypothetical protein